MKKKKKKKETETGSVAFGCFNAPREVYDTAAASNIYCAAAAGAEGVAADSGCHSRQQRPGDSFEFV